jgi:hypothetical protein
MVDSKIIIQLAWIAVLALAICVIPITWIGVIAFRRMIPDTEHNPAYTFSQLVQRAQGLQMVTVILIVIVVAVLGLYGIVKDEALVSILSGIAGYVLGGLQKNAPEKQAT